MKTIVYISKDLSIPSSEVVFKSMRSGGPGGQHVNKVSTAVQLSFDIAHSSLPEPVKQRALLATDRRLSREGILRLRVSKHRSQYLNKQEAISRLIAWLDHFITPPKQRKATRPTKSSKEKRIKGKRVVSERKKLRRPPTME